MPDGVMSGGIDPIDDEGFAQVLKTVYQDFCIKYQGLRAYVADTIKNHAHNADRLGRAYFAMGQSFILFLKAKQKKDKAEILRRGGPECEALADQTPAATAIQVFEPLHRRLKDELRTHIRDFLAIHQEMGRLDIKAGSSVTGDAAVVVYALFKALRHRQLVWAASVERGIKLILHHDAWRALFNNARCSRHTAAAYLAPCGYSRYYKLSAMFRDFQKAHAEIGIQIKAEQGHFIKIVQHPARRYLPPDFTRLKAYPDLPMGVAATGNFARAEVHFACGHWAPPNSGRHNIFSDSNNDIKLCPSSAPHGWQEAIMHGFPCADTDKISIRVVDKADAMHIRSQRLRDHGARDGYSDCAAIALPEMFFHARILVKLTFKHPLRAAKAYAAMGAKSFFLEGSDFDYRDKQPLCLNKWSKIYAPDACRDWIKPGQTFLSIVSRERQPARQPFHAAMPVLIENEAKGQRWSDSRDVLAKRRATKGTANEGYTYEIPRCVLDAVEIKFWIDSSHCLLVAPSGRPFRVSLNDMVRGADFHQRSDDPEITDDQLAALGSPFSMADDSDDTADIAAQMRAEAHPDAIFNHLGKDAQSPPRFTRASPPPSPTSDLVKSMRGVAVSDPTRGVTTAKGQQAPGVPLPPPSQDASLPPPPLIRQPTTWGDGRSNAAERNPHCRPTVGDLHPRAGPGGSKTEPTPCIAFSPPPMGGMAVQQPLSPMYSPTSPVFSPPSPVHDQDPARIQRSPSPAHSLDGKFTQSDSDAEHKIVQHIGYKKTAGNAPSSMDMDDGIIQVNTGMLDGDNDKNRVSARPSTPDITARFETFCETLPPLEQARMRELYNHKTARHNENENGAESDSSSDMSSSGSSAYTSSSAGTNGTSNSAIRHKLCGSTPGPSPARAAHAAGRGTTTVFRKEGDKSNYLAGKKYIEVPIERRALKRNNTVSWSDADKRPRK